MHRRYPALRAALYAALLLALPLSLPARAAAPQPFEADTFDALREQYAGKPFLLVLWSIHCAPCFAELKMLGEMLEEDPSLPVVLVATDPAESAGEVQLVLEDYGLADHSSWQFAGDFPERLRYVIDPDWYGELPRSYFHDAAHQRDAHSGALDRAAVEAWRQSVRE